MLLFARKKRSKTCKTCKKSLHCWPTSRELRIFERTKRERAMKEEIKVETNDNKKDDDAVT